MDDEDAHFTEASYAARADAERAATDARERAFAAFDARWRRPRRGLGVDRGEGDGTSEEAPTGGSAHRRSRLSPRRWRTKARGGASRLERASARARGRGERARGGGALGDEAWRAYAPRGAREAGFGARVAVPPELRKELACLLAVFK